MDDRLFPPWMLFRHAPRGTICSTKHDGVVLAVDLPIEEAEAIVALSKSDPVATNGFVRIIGTDRAKLQELAARNAVLREVLESAPASAQIEAALASPGESLLARLRESEALVYALSEELVRLGAENEDLRNAGTKRQGGFSRE